MNRNRLLAAALGIAALASGAAFAAEPAKAPADKPAASQVHVVIFHLKKDAPADAAAEIIAGCRTLEAIPSVRLLKVGRPAPADESTPKVSIHDYDVGLTVLFDDAAGLKTYLEHPTHLKFVHTYDKYFETVQVYDFVDQKK